MDLQTSTLWTISEKQTEVDVYVGLYAYLYAMLALVAGMVLWGHYILTWTLQLFVSEIEVVEDLDIGNLQVQSPTSFYLKQYWESLGAG